jgi:Sds3-like.
MQFTKLDNYLELTCSAFSCITANLYFRPKVHTSQYFARNDKLQYCRCCSLIKAFIFCTFDYRMYQDKLASLKKQLQQLKDGTHPEYNRKLKKLDAAFKER